MDGRSSVVADVKTLTFFSLASRCPSTVRICIQSFQKPASRSFRAAAKLGRSEPVALIAEANARTTYPTFVVAAQLHLSAGPPQSWQTNHGTHPAQATPPRLPRNSRPGTTSSQATVQTFEVEELTSLGATRAQGLEQLCCSHPRVRESIIPCLFPACLTTALEASGLPYNEPFACFLHLPTFALHMLCSTLRPVVGYFASFLLYVSPPSNQRQPASWPRRADGTRKKKKKKRR